MPIETVSVADPREPISISSPSSSSPNTGSSAPDGVTVLAKAGIEAQRRPSPASRSCARMFPDETTCMGNGRTFPDISHSRWV